MKLNEILDSSSRKFKQMIECAGRLSQAYKHKYYSCIQTPCYGFMIMRHLGFLKNGFRLLATKFKDCGLFVLRFITIGPYRIDYFQNVPELWIIRNPPPRNNTATHIDCDNKY